MFIMIAVFGFASVVLAGAVLSLGIELLLDTKWNKSSI
jgi:hypothetical protein